ELGQTLADGARDPLRLGGSPACFAIIVEGGAQGAHGVLSRLAGQVGLAEEGRPATLQLAIGRCLTGAEALRRPWVRSQALDRLGRIAVAAPALPDQQAVSFAELARRGADIFDGGRDSGDLLPLVVEAAGLVRERCEARGVALDRGDGVVAGEILRGCAG